MNLNVAHITPNTEAEGPGKRFALWFQGCPLRCPGCCNPEMLAFKDKPMDFNKITEILLEQTELEGITLLGGEPTAHLEGAIALSKFAHKINLNVMVFSGYYLSELRARNDLMLNEFLQEIDILVDGPYKRELQEKSRRWIGSSNQNIHFLSNRCDPDDPRWKMPNTIEIRMERSVISINGFPSKKVI